MYIRTLVPNTIKGVFFGTRDLKYWVLGPSVLLNFPVELRSVILNSTDPSGYRQPKVGAAHVL